MPRKPFLLGEVFTVGAEKINDELFVSYIRPPPSKLFIPIPSETAKPHIYQRLPRGHARLLRRVPQPNKNELIFEFSSIPIPDIWDRRPRKEPQHEYKAISYCWGNLPTARVLVLADGSTIPITKKVACILEVILSRVRCEAIWLDAICINQQDPVEKAEQVQLMPGIYYHATSVEIHLDAGRPSMQVVSEAANSQDTSSKATFSAGMLRPDDSYSALTPYTNEEIFEIMWSPWFERAWVVQEYCYSQAANFHYRGIMMGMLFLEKVHGWGVDLAFGRIEDGNGSRVELPIPPMIRHFGALNLMRREVRQRDLLQVPLEDVLCRFYHCKATDPRDKVIAFLGLANGELLRKIIIDYEQTPTALYLDVMKTMIQQSTDYALFGFAGIVSRRPLFEDDPNIPSWLPDLSTPPHYATWSCQWQRFDASSLGQFKGVRISFLDWGKHLGFQRDDLPSNVIVAHGTRIGTVLGSVEGDERDNFAYLPSFITTALEISEHVSPYITGESARDVLWNTLIAGNPQCLEHDKSGAGFDQLCEWAKTGNLNLDKIWALHGRYYQTMLAEGAGGGRGLFWTENGYIGLATNGLQPGDEVWILMGARVPFILRRKVRYPLKVERTDDTFNVVDTHVLVTEAYVHGAMKGKLNEGSLERILLV
ncbi:heterokaryon incompatibility protein-domain-containing protein [Xylaria digitata]|nr:heterokaryon incompatibility protein-domain-containing protein [Xylaria digitata]